MPALQNPRWEAFAQGVASGLPAYKAYLDAGYKCSQKDAFSSSSVLSRNPKVFARVRELNEMLAERMNVTRESLAREYDHIAQAAYADGQFAAAKGAIEAKQSVLGLDTEKKNINVNINATFNQMTDDELRFEVASMVNELRAMKGQPPLALPAKKDGKDE
jgi:hypothetical protein